MASQYYDVDIVYTFALLVVCLMSRLSENQLRLNCSIGDLEMVFCLFLRHSLQHKLHAFYGIPIFWAGYFTL